MPSSGTAFAFQNFTSVRNSNFPIFFGPFALFILLALTSPLQLPPTRKQRSQKQRHFRRLKPCIAYRDWYWVWASCFPKSHEREAFGCFVLGMGMYGGNTGDLVSVTFILNFLLFSFFPYLFFFLSLCLPILLLFPFFFTTSSFFSSLSLAFSFSLSLSFLSLSYRSGFRKPHVSLGPERSDLREWPAWKWLYMGISGVSESGVGV